MNTTVLQVQCGTCLQVVNGEWPSCLQQQRPGSPMRTFAGAVERLQRPSSCQLGLLAGGQAGRGRAGCAQRQRSHIPAATTPRVPACCLPARLPAVPAHALQQLLVSKTYECPHCKSRQSITLNSTQEAALRVQAQQLIAQQQHAQRLMAQRQQMIAQQQELARRQVIEHAVRGGGCMFGQKGRAGSGGAACPLACFVVFCAMASALCARHCFRACLWKSCLGMGSC